MLGPNQRFELCFGSQMAKNYKLIEVPMELATRIEQGESLVMKGTETEEAVICTQSRTYTLKRVETSNAGTIYLEILM
jgi:sister chromatid cohesion protein DCC1